MHHGVQSGGINGQHFSLESGFPGDGRSPPTNSGSLSPICQTCSTMPCPSHPGPTLLANIIPVNSALFETQDVKEKLSNTGPPCQQYGKQRYATPSFWHATMLDFNSASPDSIHAKNKQERCHRYQGALFCVSTLVPLVSVSLYAGGASLVVVTL